jgi:signal transduction histidine kinase
VSNSLKFSKPGVAPKISISSTLLSSGELHDGTTINSNSKYVEIVIEDNGIGIEEPHLEQVFDIFSRLNYEPTAESFGVGLAFCRKVVRLHKGVISAESKVGVGTKFLIVLPISKSKEF